jgi:hypothetical protein
VPYHPPYHEVVHMYTKGANIGDAL